MSNAADAELMLAMSRQYGSLPLMGCWPQLNSSSGSGFGFGSVPGVTDPAIAMESQIKMLELAQHSSSADQVPPPPPAHSGSGGAAGFFTRQPSVPIAGGHLNDPYLHAAMLVRLARHSCALVGFVLWSKTVFHVANGYLSVYLCVSGGRMVAGGVSDELPQVKICFQLMLTLFLDN